MTSVVSLVAEENFTEVSVKNEAVEVEPSNPSSSNSNDETTPENTGIPFQINHHTNPDLFRCQVCFLSFPDKATLLVHKRMHMPSLTSGYVGHGCDFFLVENIQTQKDDHVFICKFCGSKFLYERDLIGHGKIHEHMKPVTCSFCNAKFAHRAILTDHLKTHSGSLMNCTFCDAKFRDVRTKVLHEIHHKHRRKQNEQFKCKVCKLKFGSHVEREWHVKAHLWPKINCSSCTSKFSLLSALIKHKRRHIRKGSQRTSDSCTDLVCYENLDSLRKCYSCNFCELKFDQLAALMKHKKVHAEKKRYKCQFCGSVFAWAKQLLYHTNIHTGEKPFVCELCNERFPDPRELIKHKKSHRVQVPFQCNFCDAQFKRRYQLVRHIRVHTGEKPFECSFCGKGFSCISYLKRHYQCSHEKKSEVVIEQVSHRGSSNS